MMQSVEAIAKIVGYDISQLTSITKTHDTAKPAKKMVEHKIDVKKSIPKKPQATTSEAKKKNSDVFP